MLFAAVHAARVLAEAEGRPFSYSGVLRKLDLSVSGYVAYLAWVESETERLRREIMEKIQEIYFEYNRIYGAPKITVILHAMGYTVCERTVGVYMRKMGLRAVWVKPWTQTTTDPDLSSVLRNILDERFNPTDPDAVWCSDMTYIYTFKDGFVYLCCVMDLYSRRIVAWTLSKTMDASLVVETIEKAIRENGGVRPRVIHTDRGSQYTSGDWAEATEGITRSYSDKGYPYHNAPQEAFHSLLKREWLNRFDIADYDEAYRLVFEYIDAFYNTKRIHSHCDYMSPDEYEKQYWQTREQETTEENTSDKDGQDSTSGEENRTDEEKFSSETTFPTN